MEKPRYGVRNPAELSFESPLLRRVILAAYWVVVLLAVPAWWRTTSIERLSLPTSQVLAQAKREIEFPLNIHLSSTIGSVDTNVLAGELERSLRGRLSQTLSVVTRESSDLSVSLESGSYEVRLTGDPQGSVIEEKTLIHYWDVQDPTATSVLTGRLAALVSPYTEHSHAEDREHVISKYASRYRIAFTLLNEDAALGKSALTWEIRETIHRSIKPVLRGLSTLHNFTVESQVQFHAPLAFEPTSINVNGSKVYGLTPEDLTVFVNSAEWTLSSGVTNDPVLHFVLFVPSAPRRPLHILDRTGYPVGTHSFILPQWGGVIIYNPPSSFQDHFHLSTSHLEPIIPIFRHQLLSLLGVPSLPKGVKYADCSSLSSWQIDALLRRRARENVREAQQTLESIVKLVEQIENMPVGQDVKQDVEDALAALDQVYAAAAAVSPKLAFDHSNRAITLASRAFFNPGMLALLYFPPEHRVAVYMPLFASATVPLVVVVIREIVAWRKQRKAVAVTSM